MNFDYSDEQQQLADSLQKYLASQYSFEQRKAILNSASGVSATVWTTFAEMGLTSIALPMHASAQTDDRAAARAEFEQGSAAFAANSFEQDC
jgi:alkylation response protein AidB-like acyl-CoA dehydrogenase